MYNAGADPRRIRLQVAGCQVFAEVADIQIFTRGPGDELRCAETAAVLPDILTQPVKQRREIAPAMHACNPGSAVLAAWNSCAAYIAPSV